MQVGAGILNVDLPMDIRDISADIRNWEWSWEHAGQTVLDGVGLLPVVGTLKYTDEVGTLVKPVVKHGDEVVLAGEKTIKYADEAKEVIQQVEKNTSKNVDKAIDVTQGVGKAKYSVDYDEHLIKGTLGKGSKGVVGGHNLNEFKKILTDAGFNVDDCIVSIKKHPKIEGIYEIEYRIPAKRYGENGTLEVIPNQYKTIKYPKTVYDPSVITDSQMLEWGKEAMEAGTIQGRNIFGYSSNGIRFEGYVDQVTGEITNFYPVVE